MRPFLIAVATISLVGPGIASAQQRGDVSQAERQQQISKLIEDINGPDPAARIAAFEAAMGGNDQTLRRVALQQGLNSSEQILRESALRASFGGRRSLVLDLSTVAQGATPLEAAAVSGIGGRLEVLIFNFDQVSGSFAASTPMGDGECRNGGVVHNARPSSLSGDRVSFSVGVGPSCNNQPRWTFRYENDDYNMKACAGTMRLNRSGVLDGAMSCQNVSGINFRFRISASVLN